MKDNCVCERTKIKSIGKERKGRKKAEKCCSPLDFSKDEAIKWFNNLPEKLRNIGFADKIKEKYNLV